MPGSVFARGDGVTLTTVTPDDYPFLEAVHNDPGNRTQAGISRPWNRSRVAAIIEEGDTSQVFLVCADGDPKGVVTLLDIDERARTAELGYLVHPDDQGAGYATAGAALCLDHAFDERNLVKIAAEVLEGNPASVRVLEKLGFTEEGVFRAHEYADGERRDVHRFGLLAAEWTGGPARD